MPQRVPPIARIRLARSLPRLLMFPLLLVLVGAANAAAGFLTLDGTPVIVAIVSGALVALTGMLQAVYLLSVRLDVEESAVGVSWLGGARIYPLTPGPVTRVRLRGKGASRLRSRTSMLGWTVGPARLRDEEEIEVVRLAPTRSAILVPTERGRLAIAAANDDQLLDALSRAARARRRLEALADRIPAPAEAEPAAPEAEEPSEVAAPPEPEPPARALTGIERALLEQRLADERAAAEAAGLPPPVPAAPEPVIEPELPAPAAPAAAPPRRAAVPRPRLTRGILRRPRPRAAFVLLPMVAAGIAWGLGIVSGRMPEAGTDLARLTSLALVLAGPATSVGAIMALAWWPRIVGVVVAGGLAASVFIGRALIGLN